MFATDWRLTIVCLLLAPDEPAVIPFAGPEIWAAYVSVNSDLELLSPEYSPNSWGAMSWDIKWSREQMADVADAPSIGHAFRMPSHEYCHVRAKLAQERIDWIEVQQLIYPHRDWHSVKVEAAGCQRAWDRMADSTNSAGTWAYRRTALRDVLEILGPRRFFAGEWPLD